MTEPTPQFRQHHAVDAPIIDAGEFRPAWRVRTRLDQLLIDRTITPAEWIIALGFRSMVELATQREGVRAARTEFVVPSTGGPDPAIHARALRYCREMRQRFGRDAYAILVACLVDDLPWTELGRRLGVDRRTAKATVVVLIHMMGKKPS